MFSDLLSTADSLILDTFADEVVMTVHFPVSSGFPDIPGIRAIPFNPIEEQYIPASPQPTGMLVLFARATLYPGLERTRSTNGCTATVGLSSQQGSGDYNIDSVDSDSQGGLVFKLRLRSKAWNA